eukprot:c27256_g1_i1 orf=818-2812(-)
MCCRTKKGPVNFGMEATKCTGGVILLVSIVVMLYRHKTAALTFDVFPKILNHSGDAVSVQWNDLSFPSDLDWIGLYMPPDSDDDHYIGYELLSMCSGWALGSCIFNMSLVNMREAYQFRLFRGEISNTTEPTPMDEDNNPLPSTAHCLAVSQNIEFLNFNEPTQIHLSLTSSSGQMRVMFVIRDPLQSYVRYGPETDRLDSTTEASFMTYRQFDMCDAPANTNKGWREPGYIFDGLMENLEPGKQYFYQVGSDEGGWSKVFSFISASSDLDETFAFLFGDMGVSIPYTTFLWTQAEAKNTMKWLMRDLVELREKPSFISHIGDISYARGYAWLWDAFFSQIEPVASQAPYHVCIGNHEYDWPSQPWKPAWAENVYGTDGGGECGVPYSLRFHMPGNFSFTTGKGTLPIRNLYHSVNFGAVHFIFFSTETDFLPGSDQYNFLKEDLQDVNRDITPFVVVLGHRPMYTSDNALRDAPLSSQMRHHLEPLLIDYNVDLVLWGHVHKYERTCAIKNFVCANSDKGEKYPVHVIIGMGGQDWQPHWKPREKHPNDPIYPQPKWSVFRSDQLGYTRLHANRDTLTLSYIGNHDGEVHDVLTIHSLPSATISQRGFHVGNDSCNWLVNTVCLVVVSIIGILLGFIAALYYKQSEQRCKAYLIPKNTGETGL